MSYFAQMITVNKEAAMYIRSKFSSKSFFLFSVFFVGLRCSCIELYCADEDVSSHVDDEGKALVSIIKYHVPDSLKYRLDSELSTIITNGNYSEYIIRYIQNPDNPKDKGNPNLNFLEKIGSANRWSLLCMCADKGNAELVYLLRQNGANEDYSDDYGMTPLHRASFHGHIAVVQLLLKPIGSVDNKKRANALSVDFLGLTPGDYIRIALDRDVHGCHEIEGILEKAEKYELRKRMSQTVQLKNFISAFRGWCKANFTSEQLLSVGNIARSSNLLSFSNMFSVLSNVVPSGASAVTTLAGVAASAIEGYLADQQTNDFLDHASGVVDDIDDMDREFVKLAYYLADIYDESIQILKPAGAERLGRNAAKYVAKYLTNPSQPQNMSFVKQIEQYFLTLKRGTFESRKTLDKEGAEWTVDTVLNRTVGNSKISSKSRKVKHAGLDTLIRDGRTLDSIDGLFDLAEITRLELLLSREVEAVTYVSQTESRLSEIRSGENSSSRVTLQGIASGNSRIIGRNGASLDTDNMQINITTSDTARAIPVNTGQINTRDGVSISASLQQPSIQPLSSVRNRESGSNTKITGSASDQSMIVMINEGTIDNW